MTQIYRVHYPKPKDEIWVKGQGDRAFAVFGGEEGMTNLEQLKMKNNQSEQVAEELGRKSIIESLKFGCRKDSASGGDFPIYTISHGEVIRPIKCSI